MILSNMIRVITVKQPWTGLILGGGKNVENRTRGVSYTGRLYIHAGKAVDQQCPFQPVEPRQRGAILGYVTLVRCVEWYAIAATLRSVWHEAGMVGWYFEDPWVFDEPLPYSGNLGLWTIESTKVADRPGSPGRSYA